MLEDVLVGNCMNLELLMNDMFVLVEFAMQTDGWLPDNMRIGHDCVLRCLGNPAGSNG